MENGKEAYSLYTTVLARLMQEDLGFREYVGNPETVVCPNCGREHDAYKKCECGMTMNQTMERIGEGLREAFEEENQRETQSSRQSSNQSDNANNGEQT